MLLRSNLLININVINTNLLQEVFSCLCSEAAREDFLNGFRGAPQLNEAEILKLDTFFRLVSIDRQNLPGSFNVYFEPKGK